MALTRITPGLVFLGVGEGRCDHQHLVPARAVGVGESLHRPSHAADMGQIGVGHHQDLHSDGPRDSGQPGLALTGDDRRQAGETHLHRRRRAAPVAGPGHGDLLSLGADLDLDRPPGGRGRTEAQRRGGGQPLRRQAGGQDQPPLLLAHEHVAQHHDPLGRRPDVMAVAHAAATGARVDRLRTTGRSAMRSRPPAVRSRRTADRPRAAAPAPRAASDRRCSRNGSCPGRTPLRRSAGPSDRLRGRPPAGRRARPGRADSWRRSSRSRPRPAVGRVPPASPADRAAGRRRAGWRSIARRKSSAPAAKVSAWSVSPQDRVSAAAALSPATPKKSSQ